MIYWLQTTESRPRNLDLNLEMISNKISRERERSVVVPSMKEELNQLNDFFVHLTRIMAVWRPEC